MSLILLKAAGIKNLKVIETDGNEIIAVKRTGLSEDEKVGLALADNRTSDLSEWDLNMLEELSQEHDLNPWFDNDDLKELLGETEVLPAEGLTDPDDIPEVPEKPITKEGDLYILGNHRLLCGDSTNIQHVEKLMDNQKADLVHTDPPYNLDYSNSERPKPSKNNLGKIKNDFMSKKEFYNFLKNCLVCANSVLKKDSSSYIWHSDKEADTFIKATINSGLQFSQQIIWKKPMLLGRNRYQYAHEHCLFCVKGSPYFTNDRTKTTVWDFGGYDKSKNVHPTQKPVFIPEEAIKNSSKQNQIVLDLFGGSGSTLIAAERTNRYAYLMELDPKYCDVIVKRWEDFTGNKAKRVSSS
jgi:DNA modification methylase